MGTGLSPQAACDQAVYPFVEKLKKRYGKAGEFSLVALNNQGEWGVATNVEFTFAAGNQDAAPQIFMANPGPSQTMVIEPISAEWLEAYAKRIKAPVE